MFKHGSVLLTIGGRFSPYSPEYSADDHRQSVSYMWRNFCSTSLKPEAFEFERILKQAIARADLNRNRIASIPDEIWWKRLCEAAGDKPTSRFGGHLLRERLVHFLSNRLQVEEAWAVRQQQLESMQIKEPIFIIGLPRSGKHLATHMYARGGHTFPLRYRDANFIGIVNEEERENAAKKYLKGWQRLHPAMQTVRTFNFDHCDDDLSLHMQSPQSYAWGLLHGLPDYLYRTIQEADQQPVINHTKRCLQLLQWYRDCGQNGDGVSREVTELGNPIDTALDGDKDDIQLHEKPWLVHSAFGILYTPHLHEAYPDMRVIWMHRDVKGSVQSLCSSLQLHDNMYTGRSPRESARVQVGEMVLGLFGSGSEQAVDYMGTFPYDRMVHWDIRDHRRSGLRLMRKTHVEWWGAEMDIFRRKQIINGFVENNDTFRPHHDARMDLFGLHDGMVNDAFRAYMFQFEEFATDKEYGIEIQDYQPISGSIDETTWGLYGRAEEDRVSSFEGMGASGHYLGQPGHWRQDKYLMSRPKVTNRKEHQGRVESPMKRLPPK